MDSAKRNDIPDFSVIPWDLDGLCSVLFCSVSFHLREKHIVQNKRKREKDLKMVIIFLT